MLTDMFIWLIPTGKKACCNVAPIKSDPATALPSSVVYRNVASPVIFINVISQNVFHYIHPRTKYYGKLCSHRCASVRGRRGTPVSGPRSLCKGRGYPNQDRVPTPRKELGQEYSPLPMNRAYHRQDTAWAGCLLRFHTGGLSCYTCLYAAFIWVGQRSVNHATHCFVFTIEDNNRISQQARHCYRPYSGGCGRVMLSLVLPIGGG